MADVTNIVDPDNGTGTDYVSLQAWEAQNLDLVTAGDTETAECRSTSGSPDFNAIGVAGWTSNATYWLKIWTDPSDSYRHNGIWPTGNKYRLVISSGGNDCIAFQSGVDYATVDGIAMQIGAGSYAYGMYLAGDVGSQYIIENCIIKAFGSYTTEIASRGIYLAWFSSGTRYADIINCVIYDFINGSDTSFVGILLYSVWAANVYNCTIYNCSAGVSGSPASLAKNVVTVGCTDGFLGTFDAASDYNCSDIAGDAPGANSVDTTQTDAQLFNDAANGDFNVADTGSDLYAAGTDLSGTFTDDIAGTTRSTWDIGAFEYVAAGGGTIPVFMKSYRDRMMGALICF